MSKETKTPAAPAPPIPFQMKTKAEIAEEKFRADKAAARAKALEGLTFPLLVVATADGFFAGQRMRKVDPRNGGKPSTFLVKDAKDYAPTWMKPAPKGAKDLLDGVTPLVRRGNKRTSRDLPSLTEGLDDRNGTLETPETPGAKTDAAKTDESVLG